MLIPKKVKFRKWQTQRSNPKAISPDTRGTKLSSDLLVLRQKLKRVSNPLKSNLLEKLSLAL